MLPFFVLSTVLLVAAGLSSDCQYVKSKYMLSDVDTVKSCFESYTLDKSFADLIVSNLEIIGDVYPYVDIARNPPQDMQRRNVIYYQAKLAEVKKDISNSGNVISKIFRPTMKFINSFHDGHFGLSVYDPSKGKENIFSSVYGILPFFWHVLPDKNGDLKVYIGPSSIVDFPDEATLELIKNNFNAKVAVTEVDGIDAFKFFSEFFEDYDIMKTLRGSLQRTQYSTNNGFKLLSYPMEKLFTTHTVKYSDGTTFTFVVTIINTNGSRSRSDPVINPVPEVSFVSIKEERDAVEKLKHFVMKKPGSKASRSSHKYIPCGLKNDMNYIVINSFSPDDLDAFADELAECIDDFDQNDKPISVLLPMNGGGYIILEYLAFNWLFPNADFRELGAFRKTDSNEIIAVENGYALSLADVDNDCQDYTQKTVDKFWEKTDVDDLGNGVKHSRTKKGFMVYKDVMSEYFQFGLKKNIRKPTDVIVVTDGFCFSACSIFVDNVLRTGSGIVTGAGPTYPGDERFVAAQCPSAVVTTDEYFDEVKDNDEHGFYFATPVFETYNISQSESEVIPTDYDVMRIDKHLGYYDMMNLNLEDVLDHTKAVYKEFQTKCNSANQRLLMVSDKCESDDKHALDVGYACGSNGEWDDKKCLIATCEPGYYVDFESNKCVECNCDVRPPASGAATVGPVVTFMLVAIISLLNIIF